MQQISRRETAHLIFLQNVKNKYQEKVDWTKSWPFSPVGMLWPLSSQPRSLYVENALFFFSSAKTVRLVRLRFPQTSFPVPQPCVGNSSYELPKISVPIPGPLALRRAVLFTSRYTLPNKSLAASGKGSGFYDHLRIQLSI